MSIEPTFQLATKSAISQPTRLIEEYYRFDEIPFHEATVHAALDQILADPSLGRVWLIKRSEELVGYVVLSFVFSLEFHGRNAVLDELYVRAGHRRRGIGTRTLQFIEDECRACGIRALHLEVERFNEETREFYRRGGFEDHDRCLMTKWIERRD